MGYWTDRRVLVTGGRGFLGSHIVRQLRAADAVVSEQASTQADLRSRGTTLNVFLAERPTVVIHAAALCGGLKLNMEEPAQLLHDNIQMGLNVFEATQWVKVEKLVVVGSACCYPGIVVGQLCERKIWDGPVHESVIGYGNAKRTLIALGDSYRAQHGLNSIHLVLANLYGPGEPTEPGKSHVVGALVRKFTEAAKTGVEFVEVWGSGEASRELLYVKDAATAILRAAECYNKPEPLNIGTGQTTTIRGLAYAIKAATGFDGEVRFDTTKPTGVDNKTLDISRMVEELGWTPQTSLEVGLLNEVKWFTERQKDKPD